MFALILLSSQSHLQSLKACKATKSVTINPFDCVSMKEPTNETNQTKETAKNNWDLQGAGNGSFVTRHIFIKGK